MSTPTEITTPTPQAFRIFVGNLTPNVESSALETAFAEFGKVLSVRVIKKKYNSNTFGFVDMEDLESANKAVAAINGREFDGKNVSVELARERTESTTPTTQSTKPKRASTRRPRAPKVDSENTDNTTTTDSSSPTLNGKSNGTSAPRRRNVRRSNANKDTTAAATTTDATTTVAPVKTQKPKREKKPVATNAADRQQSTTTLFVRNIPYSFDDAKLLEAFKDCSPKSAHVIVNKHTSRSKGFGFVEFDDVANQQKGLSLNKLSVENRELSVKVALVQLDNTTTATTPDTTTVTA